MTRNRWGFGLGTLGRDMVAALVSMYLLFYLTDVLDVSGAQLAVVTVILVVMRIFDAVNDPFMGVIVDNTHTRWGKFKPWIFWGGLLWGIATLMIFFDTGVDGWNYVILFTVLYLVWEIAFTINDIAYWSMLPSLTRDQKERERIGVVARICANVGLFSIAVGLVPLTRWLTDVFGSERTAWFVLAVALVVIMLAFQSLNLILTRERVTTRPEATPLRELFSVIFRNDQLMWVTLAMVAYMAGYITTTSFGLYYFKYIFDDEGAYPIFAAVLGVTQIAALALFPLVSRVLKRRQIHLLATVLCLAGYVVFLFSGTSLPLVAVAGVLLFSGQGAIQLLMVMFIADSVEYGEWKLGRRNESITFSLQPFIYKLSNAIASGVVGATVIISGIDEATSAADVSVSGATTVRLSMLVLPMILMTVSYLILRARYTLDEEFYARVVREVKERHVLQAAD
ncbi:glycoside-pentoside-hexuronide (GPH):cation symporter [Tessaracoccus sp. ZS01]|uniref:glycoside-pentoside-hexuronide (GPH):cation symporter n=1 Tax=Tessaracoccus sp. ZS01 TaxID=1906324 RepID=UPI00096C1D9B|nr:glycoside-pentoside-hexuronide (GPH):cation symporter [Tessaracoccus sp. ZS01]MCG6566730.1 MFS transporter [Tessaracoccus sp. ZS01]OMG59246.1 sugar transporter [Tessaracoccus sp. ZS01]